MTFLMSCNLLNVFTKSTDSADSSEYNSSSGSNSGAEVSSGSQNTSSTDPFAISVKAKKFDGELKIVDQHYWIQEDGSVNYALLVENTSSKLTVTHFSQGAKITDASGAVLPQLNNNGGDSDSWIYNYMVFPKSEYLICSGYEVAKGSKIADVEFNLTGEITAADLGVTENPIQTESVDYIEKPSIGNKDAIGDLYAHFKNQSDKIVLYPQFDAAGYDAEGKLVGCGEAFNTYAFIPANAAMQIQVPMRGSAKPEKIDLFPHLASNSEQKYKGAEPLEVSDIEFTQVNEWVMPRYTLKNTSKGMIVDYLYNRIIYGADDKVLYLFSTRGSDLPGGMTFGPYRSVNDLRSNATASRIEVQVHTMDVRNEGSEITNESISFGPGTYNSGTGTVKVQATNSTKKELAVAIGFGCLDDAGNQIGGGGGQANLGANSETEVELYETSVGPGSACKKAAKIVVNLLSAAEN